MKILIITFTSGVNPGTFMQALGVQTAIKRIFPNANINFLKFPDFKCVGGIGSRGKSDKLWNILLQKGFAAYRLLKYAKMRKEYFCYSKSVEMFNYSPKSVEFIKQYDLVVIGSDTILEQAYGENNQIGLNWMPLEIPKIYFAASASPANFEPKEDLKKIAASAIHIGLRDHLTIKFFTEKLNIIADRIVKQPDPSYYIDIKQFKLSNRLTAKIKKGEKYALYNFNSNFPLRKKLADALRCIGYKVVTTSYNPYADICFDTIDAIGWAGVFPLMDIIVTERFHDSVFGLRNEKPVIAVDWDPSRFNKNGDSKTLRILEDYEHQHLHFNLCNNNDFSPICKAVRNIGQLFNLKKVRQINEKQIEVANIFLDHIKGTATKSLSLLIFIILNCTFIHSQTSLLKYNGKSIDYTTYFSDKVKAQSLLFQKEKCKNLDPMLEIGTIVPNGGIFRLWQGTTWKTENAARDVKIFKESSYQTNAPLIYNRFDWYLLEGKKNEYLFDKCIEPLFKIAILSHSRVSLGLACNCGSSSVKQKINGLAVAVPKYLFEKIQTSEYSMYKDNQFGNAYVPNYDSPLLLERHKALLNAFAKWINGNVQGTNIKRKNIIYSIEMRYFGYWGEGATQGGLYPKTSLFNEYIDSYIDAFPDILLLAPIQHTVHLPSEKAYIKEPNNKTYLLEMRHIGKLLSTKNKFGRLGAFIDSWNNYSNQYDLCSDKVFIDENGNVQSLASFLKEYWGKIYLTGEFGYIVTPTTANIVPYSGLYQQFCTRKVSGLSVQNLTIKRNGAPLPVSDSIYQNAANCLSMIGYRIVLSSPSLIRKRRSYYQVSFKLSNIGVSRIFHNYYKIHIITKDNYNNILTDKGSSFDLSKLVPTSSEPLLYNESKGLNVTETVKANKGNQIYIRIDDEKGIEYPMTLSNYGRQEDGSYLLGKIE